MAHEVVFKDGVLVEWQEALPLGNGKFGAFIWTTKDTLEISLNHYDIFYQEFSDAKTFAYATPYKEQVKKIKTLSSEVRFENNYIYARNPKNKDFEPIYNRSKMPETGSLQLKLQPEVHITTVTLKIEEGYVEVQLKKKAKPFLVKFFITPDDELVALGGPLQELFVGGTWHFLPQEKVTCNLSVNQGVLTDEKGRQGVLKGNFQQLTGENSQVDFLFAPAGKAFSLSILNHPSTKSPEALFKENLKTWQAFWTSQICLPDKMLETIWYEYQYMLKISSGIGSQNFKEACGLSGLWNVKNDTLWGSMWYWDVNIQAAFWGAGTSNHLELLRHFCRAYLAHEKDIRTYTKKVYGFDGWALDYPHTFYNCIQPWCAQFLIADYEYTQDKDFLSEILPVLKAQCDFAYQMFFTPEGKVEIPFDISPEQGPLTENSTITLATLQYLFEKTSALLAIIGEKIPASYDKFLESLPPYAKNAERLLDSPLTKENQWLRHPSVLMPIFPIKEKDWVAGGKFAELAKNTVDYAFHNCEVGMFGGGWIAASYAQLGLGDESLYTLYEKGLDQWMHTNGLPFEESERFMNLCIVTKLPIYLPAMMEPIGEVTRTVNEMLCQSTLDKIQLFPALPQGKIFDEEKAYAFESSDRAFVTEKWTDVKFENLLVKGGHQVSAQLVAGKLVWLKIIAGAPDEKHLISEIPTDLDLPEELSLVRGEVYEWGKSLACCQNLTDVFSHLSKTKRHIYLGKDKNTSYVKAVDASRCPYLLGNNYQYPASVLKFDFGNPENKKNYTKLFPRQVSFATPMELINTGFRQMAGKLTYEENGYFGFANGSQFKLLENPQLDDLRQDALSSEKPATFTLNMPQGKYTLLFGISGMAEKTTTGIEIADTKKVISLEKEGFKTLEWPFIHEGGPLEIKLTGDKNPWCLNFMILNKERALY